MTPELRALFPITERAVYLNHAAVSPPPVPTLRAIELQLKDVSQTGSINFRKWLSVRERARGLMARLLGARASQVAFMRNTSDALSSVANGLKWRTGDNIVTFNREFPSNVYPWLRIRDAQEVELRMCEERAGRIDLDELAGLIDRNTRVVAISHVQFASGFRVDLERVARLTRKHDALLVVDTIQSLGVIEIDVESELVDVAAGACHKWLLTPEGIGYLYLSDRARERLVPTLVGWVSVPNPEDYFNLKQGWKDDALAWESGTGPSSLFYGLEASLKLLTETGTGKIAGYLEQLTDYLCDRLDKKEYNVISSRLAGEKSQIVCVSHKGGRTPVSLYADLKSRNIVTAPRGAGLRISPHFYNTQDDIDLLLNALA